MIFDNWWNSGETLRESERWGPNQCSSRKKWESCLWPGKNHYTLYTTQGRTNVPLYTLQYSIHWTTLGRTNAPPTPSASARKMILIRAQNNKLHLYTKSVYKWYDHPNPDKGRVQNPDSRNSSAELAERGGTPPPPLGMISVTRGLNPSLTEKK